MLLRRRRSHICIWVERYKRLAEEDERFMPDLAGTLNNLGDALSDKGRLNEAIALYKQGINLLSPLKTLMPWHSSLLASLHQAFPSPYSPREKKRKLFPTSTDL